MILGYILIGIMVLLEIITLVVLVKLSYDKNKINNEFLDKLKKIIEKDD